MLKVKVEGLRELQAELKASDPKLARELTKAHRQVAMTVLVMAREELASQPVPKADEAAAGMVVAAGQRSASIVHKGDNPFVRAVEFGTSWHKVFGRWVEASKMKRRVYRPWAGNGDEAGYALYPVLRQFLPSAKFEDIYHDAIDQAYARAFPERIG